MDSHDKDRPIIIIKKIKKIHAGHHGGAWKIAYADFVTAMMALFLMMWLLSMLNKYQLQGIAEYFKTPMKEVFNKQSMLKDEKNFKPDELGPTADKSKGSLADTKFASEKNAGTQLTKQDAVKKPYPLQKDELISAGKEKQSNADDKDDLKKQANGDKFDGKKQETQEEFKNKITQVANLAQLKAMQGQLEAKLNSDPQASQFKNSLNFVITSDGLKVVIKDLENKPMFTSGKADFNKYAKNMLAWLTQQINQYRNRIIIIGHTDAQPYVKPHYSNWELSADRANATREILLNSGMANDKVLRVIGGADTTLSNTANGKDPSNRRIEIIILTDDATKIQSVQLRLPYPLDLKMQKPPFQV